MEAIWTNQWGCEKRAIHILHGKSDGGGVLIACREGLDYKIDSVFRDNDGRYLIIQTKIQDEPFILVKYYAPNEEGGQIPVLSTINEIIQNLETEEDTTTIWEGDFNLFFDVQLDADRGSPKFKLNSVCKLVRTMSEKDLCDIYRLCFPYEKRFTWRRKPPIKQRRLDHFLISDGLQDLVNEIEIIPSVQSDHSALKMKISSLTEDSKEPSYWKFNNTLVSDDEYVNNMKSKIPEFYRDSLVLQDPVSRWEFLKYRMRQYSMKVAKQKTCDSQV